MAVTVLTPSSPGAPTFNGSVGSFITLMDFCLVTTLGWSKVFSGTNVASYRAPTGNRFYLGVNDTATLNVRLRGFETMSAAGVAEASGTGPFPTDAQVSGGGYFYKGADTTTAKTWLFVSDGKMFYLVNNANSSNQAMLTFGDFTSYKSADGYNTALCCEASASNYAGCYALASSYSGAATAGVFIARSYTQIGGSMPGQRLCDSIFAGLYIGASGPAYPSPIDGALLMAKIGLGEQNQGFRGELPGLWNPLHNKPLSDGDTFTGTGALSGKSFIAKNIGNGGQVFIETSDTWGA